MRCFSLAIVILLLATACASNEGVNEPAAPSGPTPTRAAAALLEPAPEVQPVRFPDDEAPHDMLTEWWYYTGHLYTEDGNRYGFEYVFFQGNRGAFPPMFAAHFAVTDNVNGTFTYDQKSGPGASQPGAEGFALELDGWSMSGALGNDQVSAEMDGYAIDLTLTSSKPPALHNDVGYVDFGPAGGSYYYSRTRIEATGFLTVDGERLPVTGHAWMDHQWGNFISVGAGGWDWFSVQMDSNEELTISLIYDVDGEIIMSYGTVVGDDGEALHLDHGTFEVQPTASWESPDSGAVYPIAWTIEVPEHEWDIQLVATMPDQELDTTATTGVIYWEGEVEVSGSVGGEPGTGLGYVELTGYAPLQVPLEPPTP